MQYYRLITQPSLFINIVPGHHISNIYIHLIYIMIEVLKLEPTIYWPDSLVHGV